MHLSPHDITIFLLLISVLLFFGRLFGEIFRYLKQPSVIGEIFAGILLGPTVFGTIFPDAFNSLINSSPAVNTSLEGITTLAVVMLLLVSGLEVNLAIVFRQGKPALYTSGMGILFPFAIGFSAAYLFPQFIGIQDESMRFIFALFIGTSLSITALPVVARTLMDLNIFKTDIGFLIVAAAMFNDLIGWIIFSIILGMIGSSSHGLDISSVIIITLVFVVFILIAGRKIFNRMIPIVQNKFAFPGGILNFIFILGFMGAAFTEYLGIHAIFGAFMVGIAIGDSVHLKEETREMIQQFVTNIFAPLFFLSIGLKVNFIENFDLALVVIFLVLAFAGKVIGCSLGAYWGGLKKYESLVIGFGMNSRGAMEIVLGLLALNVGLIQEKVFVALVIMALVTSISSAPFMNYFLKRYKKEMTLKNIIKPNLIFFTEQSDKNVIIDQLVNKISDYFKLDADYVKKEIKSREEVVSTGLENYLALPHAKVKVNEPYAAIAISKTGVDFNSNDELPSKIIIMLLTPKDQNELQLRLISEVAKMFENKNEIEELLELNSEMEFYDKFLDLNKTKTEQ